MTSGGAAVLPLLQAPVEARRRRVAAEAASAALATTAAASGPRGQLAVTFTADPTGRTFVGAQRATHPYHLCRALYRADDPPGLCTLYVQGCSGGLFQRDRVALSFAVGPRAAAHVTTAAATIVHRMSDGDRAEQTVVLDVAAGGWLEYAPDPMILFPGSRLAARTRVRLAGGARAIVVDGFLGHHLPDDARPFEWFEGETRIEDGAGQLLARERFVVPGEAFQAGGRGQMGAYACHTTLFVLGAGEVPLAAMRAALRDATGGGAPTYGGASALPGGAGVIARLLATDGTALRAGLDACWSAAREALGLPAGRRRPK
jgi:urease accessory protein